MNKQQEQVRRDNLRRILDLLRRRDGISQIELVNETGLRASTVSNLVRRLRNGGFVRETGRGNSGSAGGKPPVMLGLRPDRGAYVGILWDSGAISVRLLDFRGRPIGSTHSFEIDRAGTEPSADALLDQIGRLAARCWNGAAAAETAAVAADTGAAAAKTAPAAADVADTGAAAAETGAAAAKAAPAAAVLGVGIAVGSVVDSTGAIKPSADFPWDVSDAADTFRTIIGRVFPLPPETPVVVENDANCVALDAHRTLPEVPQTIVAFVVTDAPASVGAGLIVDDRLLRGRSGAAGEILASGDGHDRSTVDEACAATVRMLDPDYVTVALPVGVEISRLPAMRRAIGDRPFHTLNQSQAALSGAAYLAYRASIDSIVQGG